MQASGNGTHDPVQRGIQLAERLCTLPAVATTSWPDLAARVISLIEPGSLAWVMIAQIDENGAIVSREAAGVGSASPASDRPRLLAMRSAVERIDTLGFAPTDADLERGMVGTADTLIGAGWKDRAIARSWSPETPSSILLACTALGPASSRRAIIAGAAIGGSRGAPALTPNGSDADSAIALKVLGGLLPVLRRRAVLAIGERPSTASRWLTEREQVVLERLALGRSVREIAEEIDRSPHTVHDHVKSLHRKLNASSRGELVARALGYIDDDHNVVGAFSAVLDIDTDAGASITAEPKQGVAPRPIHPDVGVPAQIAEPKPGAARPLAPRDRDALG